MCAESATLPAGPFAAWRRAMRRALRDGTATDVACDGCTGCCTSAMFVHVAPEDAAALAVIPAALLVAAPGLPPGHRVMGYDGRGHCPMLGERGCSIHPQRPRTCRVFDCRVFAAAEVAGPPAVDERARRWRFEYPEAADRAEHDAVIAAAAFVRAHAAEFPGGRVPEDPARLAVLALEVADLFVGRDGAPAPADGLAPAALAEAIVAASRAGEAGRT